MAIESEMWCCGELDMANGSKRQFAGGGGDVSSEYLQRVCSSRWWLLMVMQDQVVVER